MSVIMLILSNFMFIAIYSEIKRKLKNNKINSKNKIKLFDILIAIMLIIYIIAHNIVMDEFIPNDVINIVDRLTVNNIIIFLSPFFWVSIIHFLNKIFSKIKINKKAKIKMMDEYIFYRDDLSKISPSTISFISNFKTDIHRDISATLLKLKLEGYIEEKNNLLFITNKKNNNLLESEKLLIKAIQTKKFDSKLYIKLVEQEAIERKLIKKIKGNIKEVIKIIATLFLPIIVSILILIIVIISCMILDEKYPIIEFNDIEYVKVDKEVYDEIGRDEKEGNLTTEDRLENLRKRTQNINDKVRIANSEGEYFVRLDKLGFLYNLQSILLGGGMLIAFFSVIITLSLIIIQIRYFNKNYIRTAKGVEIVNKAYGLKNYLKKYSDIKNRNEKELILWEYYLIYAVALDVNIKIENEVINKFVNSII